MDDPAAADVLIQAYPKLAPALLDTAFAQLIKRADWSMALLQAVADKNISLANLGPSSVHRLRTHADAKVAERAKGLIDQLRGPEQKEKDKLVSQYLPVAEKLGDLGNGKKLSTRIARFVILSKEQAATSHPTLPAWVCTGRTNC